MREKLKWLESSEKELQNMTSMGQDVPTIQDQIKELKVIPFWIFKCTDQNDFMRGHKDIEKGGSF